MITSQDHNDERQSSEKQNTITQYLIAEFETLHQRANLQEQIIANRINLFFAITTATVGGIVLAISNDFLSPFVVPGTFLVTAFLLRGGWLTLLQVLDSHYSSISFYRRAGRIRRWFLDHEPKVNPYVPFPVGDDTPSFYVKHAGPTGVDAILLLINAGIAAILVFAAFLLALKWLALDSEGDNSRWHWVGLSLGLLVFAATWILQVRKVKRFLESKEKEAVEEKKIRFPQKA